MKKTTSNILFIALMALLLFSLSGCAQEKEENTKENDPQAREAILQCCETIFGSTEETGAGGSPAMLRVDLWQRRGNGKLSHPRDGRAGRRARG